MSFTWTNDISVGVTKLDNQHQFLFYIINKLEGMSGDLAGEELDKYVKSLNHYVQIHFQTEEEYFQRYNYTEKLEHEKEHMDFVNQVIRYKKIHKNDESVSTAELHNFLSNWIIDHILQCDMKYKGLFPK